MIGGLVAAAGMGTRDGPWTMIFPKALLPLVTKSNGDYQIRPMLDLILMALKKAGCRKICIVRRSDDDAITRYIKVMWPMDDVDFVVQESPRGFGDAVYRGLPCLGNAKWIVVHADDGIIRGEGMRLANALNLAEGYGADGVVFVRRVENPSKYGVVQQFERLSDNIYLLLDVEEKPRSPRSNLALTAVYLFRRSILEEYLPRVSGLYVEFTDAIRMAIEEGARVLAVEVDGSDWVSIGNPMGYMRAQGIIGNLSIFELT